MGLALGQLEADWTAFEIYESMDFGGQAAAPATHAKGSLIFYDRWQYVDGRGSGRSII
jgi:hypothetical protein